MNPLNAVHRRSSVRLALSGFVALGLVALPACGSDEDDTETPVETVVDGLTPADTMVTDTMVTDTMVTDTMVTDTMVTDETMAP